MEEDIIQKYTETVIKQIVKKDDEYTREMIKEYVRAKYPNEKVRIDFYDEETINQIIDLGINALKNEKTVQNCLHCGNDTPLYCEKCQQELITKNADLQLENKELRTLANKTLWISPYYVSKNYIPKQLIRDKIEELEKEQKQLLKGMKGQDRYDVKQEYMYKINTLKELLNEVN